MSHEEGKQRAGGRSEYWRQLISEWSASGLSQVGFCAERGVSVGSFRCWKWKLKQVQWL